MTLKTGTTSLLALAAALAAGAASAQDMHFNRIASFATTGNSPDAEETSAEIIAATADGMTLIYTDSPAGVVGLIDITDPAAPAPLGEIAMDGGEPTSVAVYGSTAYVGVNTSESYTAPSGFLVALDIATQEELGRCDLGGQPDSVAIAKDDSFVTVAIENERDEDLGDGRVGQMPGGFLAIVPLAEGALDCAGLIQADVTGLSDIAPEDPEPEFVDVNGLGEIVLTMQENNWLVVLSATGEVLGSFSAGTVDLDGVDATEDDALAFTESLTAIPREPDAVNWIDDDHFAIANEGDMDGGSRGWSIFAKDGTLVYDSGTSFEHALIEIGHYPEGRSENKGVEPESIEFGTFGETPFVFVGSERGSVVGVYDVTDPAAPVLTQLLPSGIGPEGYVVIPERNLLVSANETDLGPDGGIRAHVMIYEYQEAPAAYPMLTSAGAESLIGWGAISGMVADGSTIYAVNDSFYAGSPTIYTIDTTTTPATITDALPIAFGETRLDLEGITLDGEGGFWVASEGKLEEGFYNAFYHISAEGEILEEVRLPEELEAVQTNSGFEGVTLIDGVLWGAQQRPWSDDAENSVKLLAYDTATGEWGAVAYPLDVPATGWIGLSEIVAHGDHVYLIERDNQIGANVGVKQVTRVPLAEMVPVALGGDYPVVTKEVVYDIAPDLLQLNGYAQDKVEGLAFTEDGMMWISTDNDGVDDHSGETLFWSVELPM
ncbi:esterase-like activity of phytase family protein [Pseudoroseicyclus sp. CXY001]|uniref:esterase-like activity of phytase family protein n=1 Tax=Pseudoroseicyclus sp. CXY001 TaxID=3242492 RepID=UPI00357103D4